MAKAIEQILKDHYMDGVFHTHVSMIQPKGKFQFNRQGFENFWGIYSKSILDNEDIIVGVAEKPQGYLPVLVDIDIKLEDTGAIDFGDHVYTDTHVDNVVQIYQSVLRNIVEDCKDYHLVCVLLEKPIYYLQVKNTMYIKNGFHLHFPNIFLNEMNHKIHLIPRIQEELKKSEIFSDLGIADSSSVFDKAYYTVPWLLYGSRKSEDMEPYRASCVFTSSCERVSVEEGLKMCRIFDQQEKLINIKGRVKEYLPRILSIIPYGRQTQEIKHGLISPVKDQIANKQKDKIKSVLNINSVEALKISARLLPMIADFRAEDRNEWMTIGWGLYNIGDGTSQALDQWIEFSSRCEEKFDEGKCIYEWERMNKKDITLGTLRYYASIDSPEEYKKYKQEIAEKHVAESLNGAHNDVAKVLFSLYGTEFVCASISNKIWYQFRGDYWEEIEEGVFLRMKISSEIAALYGMKCKEILDNMVVTEDDKAENSMLGTKMKLVYKMISNCKSAPFKSQVMKEAMEVFYDRRFKEKLDQNPWLIGFSNGIYDLKENVFRAGRPEDFISKVLPIEYQEYDESDTPVQDVIEFLMKVFPDESIRNYFLDMYSDIFVGGNTHKKVFFWTGEGDNGKSVTQGLFEKMLGGLAIKLNTQYFTGKKIAAGGANPELARAAPPIRSVMLEEPDANEQLNIGELKKLSGNDSYIARDLFEKGKGMKEVTAMFMLSWICNKLPKIRSPDKATWNRIRVIPFESTFVEPGMPCPERLEDQMKQKRFPMDKGFNSKIPGMVQAFAWYLLQWRKQERKLFEPEKVKEATASYRRDNDIFRQFTEECIIEDDSKLSISELYSHFKEWFKEGFPNNTMPIKNEIKEYFDKQWGPVKTTWRGYRIRTIQDDVDKGIAFVLTENDLVDYNSDGKMLPPL